MIWQQKCQCGYLSHAAGQEILPVARNKAGGTARETAPHAKSLKERIGRTKDKYDQDDDNDDGLQWKDKWAQSEHAIRIDGPMERVASILQDRLVSCQCVNAKPERLRGACLQS